MPGSVLGAGETNRYNVCSYWAHIPVEKTDGKQQHAFDLGPHQGQQGAWTDTVWGFTDLGFESWIHYDV